MKTRHLLFIVFSGIILVSTLPQNSYACSCVADEPIEDRVDQTDIIFSGKLIERIEDIKKKTFIFEIDKLWKTNSDKILLEQKNITIFTAIDEGVCGTDFTVGLDYLVYANMQGKTAHTSLCSGNDLLSLKNTDLEFLSTYNEEPEQNIEQISKEKQNCREVDTLVNGICIPSDQLKVNEYNFRENLQTGETISNPEVIVIIESLGAILIVFFIVLYAIKKRRK